MKTINLITTIFLLTSCGYGADDDADKKGNGQESENSLDDSNSTGHSASGVKQEATKRLDISHLAIEMKLADGVKAKAESLLSAELVFDDPKTKETLFYEFRINSERAIEYLRQPVQLSEKVVLQPNSDPVKDGEIYQVSYQIEGGTAFAMLRLRPNSDSGGLVVLVISAKKASVENKDDASKDGATSADAAKGLVAKSLRQAKFGQMTEDTQAQSFLGQGTWKVKKILSDGDYDNSFSNETETTLQLCRDRYFYKEKSTSYFSGGDVGGSFEDEKTSQGIWRIYKTNSIYLLVTLDDDSGETLPMVVEFSPSQNIFSTETMTFQLSENNCD